jgi:hypothetical protein
MGVSDQIAAGDLITMLIAKTTVKGRRFSGARPSVGTTVDAVYFSVSLESSAAY